MWMRRRGLTGCAIETCATKPWPKNELSRLCVRSTNWSIRSEERRVGSEWSSDVCSSDLDVDAQARADRMRHRDVRDQALAEERALAPVRAVDELVDQIGRASCRE